MSHPLPVTFAVSLDGLGPAQIAAWVFVPQNVSDLLPPLWLLCIPGGSYRGLAYYDRQVPDSTPDAYSMARFLASQGIGSLVIDNLGTSDSRVAVPGTLLTRAVYADVYAQLAAALRDRLAHGTLATELTAVDASRLFLVGVGHSMGGMILTQVQAKGQPCDAVCLLGWATLTVSGLLPGTTLDGAAFARTAPLDGYLPPTSRPQMRPFFYSPAVPEALIAIDEQEATVAPVGLLDGLAPRALCEAAACLTCPLYLGFGGACDLTATPQQEVAAYPAVTSLTLFVQPDAGHCTNFEPTRFALWKDIAAWVRAKAGQENLRGPSPRAVSEEPFATQPLVV